MAGKKLQIEDLCKNGHELIPDHISLFTYKRTGSVAVRCRLCQNQSAKNRRLRNPEQYKAIAKRWRDKHPNYQKEKAQRDKLKPWRDRRRSLYGIDEKGYVKLWYEQNGQCCICHTPEDVNCKRMCIDHDHETGKVRGLLCQRCNTGLGQFKDSVDNLQRAISYLIETRREAINA